MIFLDGKSIGTSPLERPFYYFGTREIAAEKDGYARTVKMVPIKGKWYEFFPFDIFTEFLPLFPRKDLRIISMKLRPARRNFSAQQDPESEEAAIEALLQRATQMRSWTPLHVNSSPSTP